MIYGIIPARGGSKGLPGKNIKPILGKPLIAWTIESAKQSRLIDEFVVSTDDPKIADVADFYGAKVHMRPKELAQDDSTTIDLVTHIAEKNKHAEHFVVLQPTSPLRDRGLIDNCINTYIGGEFDNLATGYTCKYQEFGKHNNQRRQDIQGFFYDDGNVYILKRYLAIEGRWFGNNINRYLIERHQKFEIDDEIDFVILEALMQKYALKQG